MTLHRINPKELRKLRASNYKDGDVLIVGNYTIWIKYTSQDKQRIYTKPSLCSTVDRGFKPIGCTPGTDRPYYIDDFLSR